MAIEKRNKMSNLKIDQEEFNRKAQHILDTVVRPQVERYEKAKAEGTLVPKPASAVGGYKLGNTTLGLTYKPKWIHRKMMMIFFGVKWVDDLFKPE